jgi:hypothetical protein
MSANDDPITQTSKIEDRRIFIEKIQKWAKLDTQLKMINETIKDIRDMKNNLTDDICEYAENNNVNAKINIGDGQLIISERKIYSPLSYAYIEECLEKIIDDEEHIEFIINYLRDNREVEIVKEIRRTKTK